MAKKRGNNEGSISRRKDGLWQAALTVGRNPKTGKIKRAYFYGKTRKEVHDKLTKAKHDGRRRASLPRCASTTTWSSWPARQTASVIGPTSKGVTASPAQRHCRGPVT